MTIPESVTKLIERVVGEFGDKKRWRAHKALVESLPAPYRDATQALERYLTYYASITRGDILMTMLEDLGDLMSQAAADGTTVRAVVGDDPVEFAEEFVRNYAQAQWIAKERNRLTAAINRLERETP